MRILAAIGAVLLLLQMDWPVAQAQGFTGETREASLEDSLAECQAALITNATSMIEWCKEKDEPTPSRLIKISSGKVVNVCGIQAMSLQSIDAQPDFDPHFAREAYWRLNILFSGRDRGYAYKTEKAAKKDFDRIMKRAAKLDCREKP